MEHQKNAFFKPVALLLTMALLVTAVTVGLVYAAGSRGLLKGSPGSADALALSAVTADDLEADETFVFSDSGITASGSAAGSYKIENTTLTILKAGTYLVSGSCADGSVVVDKEITGVTLILQDLNLTGTSSAPVVCKKKSDTAICVAGTVTLTDGEEAATESTSNTFEGAAIKVKSNASLTIGGDGTLNIDASGCKNGIKGAAQASITVNGGLTINIQAANTGLASDGEVTIGSGNININAGNEGIKAEPDDGDTESAGNITILGGTVNVTAEDHGIMAANDLVIGTDGSEEGPEVNIANSSEGLCGTAVYLNSGSGTITAADDGINAASDDATGSENTIEINGGDWSVQSSGDGIDSNGTVVVNGGVTRVFINSTSDNNAIDYGEQSNWTINGGLIIGSDYNGSSTVPSSGTYVQFGSAGMMGGMGGRGGMGGGGMNANGAAGGRGQMGGMMPPDRNNSGSPDSGSDGMMPQDGMTPPDMTGGATSGGSNSGNAATSGTNSGEVAAGSSLNIAAGDTITVTDESGNVIFETTALQNSTHLILAGDVLESGASYTLSINGTEAASAEAQG